MKKGILTVFTLFLLCTVLLAAPKADAATSGTCGENVTWTLDDEGTLTIAGTGTLVVPTFDSWWPEFQDAAWESNRQSVKTVVINEGITVIGDNAFRAFYNLESIEIPASVTEIYWDFARDSGVKTITFKGACPKLKVSEHHDNCGDWQCDGGSCGSLCGISATVYYPAGDPSYESAMGLEFCTALNWQPYSNYLTWTATGGCVTITGLNDKTATEITIPDEIDGKPVTAIASGAFANCTALKEILFEGAAPSIDSDTFTGVTAIAYYPVNDPTWTEEVRQNYGGTITWVATGEIERIDIDVARMILGNALEFQFGVEKTAQTSWIGAYAVIEKSWADGTTTEKIIPFDQWGTADQYYAIVYDGLAAKEMGDVFNVTIYNADGTAISNPKTDSARDYVARAFDSQSDTGKTMMVDMLNYGAAAQLQFGYNTANLANNGLTDAQKAYATQDAPAMGNYQYKGLKYLGTRFVLQSRIQVQVAFEGLTSDMYAIYNYTDASGKTQSVRVEGKDFITAGARKGVELSQLVYADARGLVTVMVYNADGTLHGMAIDSIESCAYRSNGVVFAALMKFADSAKKHLYS